MSAGSTVADYLDAVRYRRYSRSVLLERRRLLGHALVCGGDAWQSQSHQAVSIQLVGKNALLSQRGTGGFFGATLG